jgi:hypothetical protein
VVTGRRHHRHHDDILLAQVIPVPRDLAPPFVLPNGNSGYVHAPKDWPYWARKLADWPRKQPEDYIQNSDDGSTQNNQGGDQGKPKVPDSVGPGPHAGDSVPAGPSATPTKDQQDKINEIGQDTGCHTCGAKDPGTKSGNFVGDHQPPTALNPPGNPQVYYPQCLSCSQTQGGLVRGLTRDQ